MKKLLAILLALLMLLCLFAGCKGGTQQSKTESKTDGPTENNPLINTDSLFPVVNKPVTLKLAVTVGPTNEDPNKMWFFKYMTKETGVKTEYMVLQQNALQEKIPIMLATDDLPDVFFGQRFTTTEIMKYGKAGSFVPLNDYIEQYGDMIKEKIDMVEGAWAGIHCPDGNIYSLPSLTIAFSSSGNGLSLNEKWMKNLGLENPETVDDLYNVLKAFKEQDADGDGDPNNEIPLTGSSTEMPLRYYLLQAFGFIGYGDICLTRDGDACYIPLHKKYYDYLVYMNKLWSEGLIDPDYYTQNQQSIYAKGEQQKFGAFPFWAAYYFTEDWQDWELITPTVEKAGQEPLTFLNTPYDLGRYTVTKACKNPDVAVRWANLFYTPEVCKLVMYGPDYGSEDDTDGTGTILTFDEDGAMNEDPPAWDPDEFGLWDWYCQNGPVTSAFCFALDEPYQFQVLYNATPFKSALPEEAIWRDQYLANVADHRTPIYPPVYLSEENVNRVDELKTALNTYVEAMEAKFIIGTEPLSNYDAFVQQLKTLGAEEYQKIYVDAYADYLANK